MEANIAVPAALIGDPTRAAILMALMDGRMQPASALARAAGVTPQAASNHLTRLLDAGMLAVYVQGRHRYYRLASPAVAAALESLASLAPVPSNLLQPMTVRGRTLRRARSCYDHLAGQLGVALVDAMVARGLLVAPASGGIDFTITDAGAAWFAELGLAVNGSTSARARPLVGRSCLDWTERRFHLAGSLGSAWFARMLELGWLERDPAGRAVKITATGATAFYAKLGIDVSCLQTAPLPAEMAVEN